MGPTIDDPTSIFLRYLNDSESIPSGGSSAVRTAERPPDPIPEDLGETERGELLIKLFATLSYQCRRANTEAAEQQAGMIAELAKKQLPELTDLANSLVAQTRGDTRGAEALLSSCLRRPHTFEPLTRPIALIERATQRMMLGLLDAALTDLAEAEQYGQSLLSLHGVAIEALIHWWRGDGPLAVEALERGPRFLIKGLDLGIEWYALAAECVHNGQLFAENLASHEDCLAREFWDARASDSAPAYLAILGPHMIRHQLAGGNDARSLLDDLRLDVSSDSAANTVFQWCSALADGDADQLSELADMFRDDGRLLAAIEAYRDAAQYAPTPEAQERFSRRGRLIHERLSRAVKVKSRPELPPSLAQVLTDAEQNVVAAVAQGLSNREAAELLNCSVRTIESHLTSSYRKLGIKRRTQLAVLIAQAKMES